MKKIIFFLASLWISQGFSQQDKTWCLGLQWGFQGNHSALSGGMETANARFQHNSFGGAALHLVARYDYNKHWMFITGIGFNSFGYEFALSENYSLRQENKRYSTLRSEFGSFEMPVLVYYKFNPNCKNAKWLVGAGFARSFTGNQTVSKVLNYDSEGTTNGTYLSSEALSKGGISTMLRFTVAREKLLKRGGILQAALLFNAGLREISSATVNYRVDGEEYQHRFINRGNFLGFRIVYFLKPFTGKKRSA